MIMKNLKKASGIFSVLGLSLILFSGCGDESAVAGSQEKSQKTRITFFAAASMTETLSSVAEKYQKEHPDVDIVFSFDSSGTLKTQIVEGAYCDIFMSASTKQMNELDKNSGKAAPGADYVLSDTRVNLLENKVVLAVPDGNPKNIGSFAELVNSLNEGRVLLAIGNSDVPVGQYTQKLFAYYGLNMDDLYRSKTLTVGNNVKEITTQVKEGVADAGIIYSTDAYSAGLTFVDTANTEMVGKVVYPVAVLKQSKHQKEARDIVNYLKNDESRRIFESVGFTVLNLDSPSE
ncbi:MAG: molybdate ABC transporter substrate-binding protein [Ruminobacter sp.]|nr:molybdate ABC transporter substrate-binding protein [Ruminobacter sp.]